MGMDNYFLVEVGEEYEVEELHYWRKNYRLHDWMFQEWKSENPDKTSVDFNKVGFSLSIERLRKLTKRVVQDYPVNPPDGRPENWKGDELLAIHLALDAIAAGYPVDYYSSW